MGGQKIAQPAEPAAAPTTAEGIQAWQAGMPQVFAEQQRQAPLEAQQQLQLQQQYGLPMAQAQQAQQNALYPQTSQLQENLAGQANQGINANQMPAWMTQQYRSGVNAQLGNQATGSPVGADYASRGLMQQGESWRNYYQNMGLSLAGRQPLTGPQSPQYTNYASGFTPNSVMNQQMTGYNSFMPYEQNYQNQLGMISMMPSQKQQILQAGGRYWAGQNYGGM